MTKKLIGSLLASIMIISAFPQISPLAEQTKENNSVSGYISIKSGIKIAGGDKAPSLYIDNSDYESVKLAAEHMKTDVETVTDKTVTMNDLNSAVIQNDKEKPAISAINPSDGTMQISKFEMLTKTGRGIIAVYNQDNTLNNIYISNNIANNTNGTLDFSQLPNFSTKKVRGFLWEENNGLTNTPIADVFTYQSSSASDWASANIVIGTLGQSNAIDTLVADNAIDVSEIRNKWESFTVQQNGEQIIIAGSDKRGTIYGIYDFCEKIGVSPWSWWADVVPEKANELYVNLPAEGYTEGEPSVKYRGIFLNDEYNFNKWSESLGNGNMNPETYKRVFELVLRLKANTMWPAMHAYSNAFHSNPQNAELANKYGVVIGSSHAEPLLRNNLGELDSFQDKWETENRGKTLYKALKNESGKSVAYYWTDHDASGNRVYNKEFLEAYWRESIEKNGKYENIYTLGMRGVHDGSFQTNMDYATALNEIIVTQRKILTEQLCTDGRKINDIPQVFIPYKDIQSLYNNGQLTIPDDVTIMWTDDNYGYLRQNADDNERARSGKTGVYYHVSYYGWPTSYLWLSTTQPGLIREELSKSYDMGADKIWILNVGDLKPAEKEIEYFARLARNVEKTRSEDITSMYATNAKRDFNMNDDDASEYAAVMDKFYELANSKRPDFFRSNDVENKLALSSSAYGDEAERYLQQYKDICVRAEILYSSLPENKKAAFFELAIYPIRSAKNMAVNYIQTERAKLYCEQSRGMAAQRYASEAKTAVSQINEDINMYNTMLGGKWSGMVNINPEKLQGCDAHITLDTNAPTLNNFDYTTLAVLTDSQTEYSDSPSITLSIYDSYDKFIDIINQGYDSFEYTVSADTNALVFDKTQGTAYGSDRVRVSVDKTQAPSGISQAIITVLQKLGNSIVDTKEIAVTIENPTETISEKTYVEASGVVSLEAEHYSTIYSNGVYKWQLEKDLGRSGDSMKIYPAIAPNADESNIAGSAAYTEYNVYFTNTGTYTWDVYRMPTLDERNNTRFAVSLDNEGPIILKGNNKYSGSQSKADAWSKGVLTNSEKISTTVTINEAGYHTLRLYNISPGITIDKMVLSKNTVNSYFGAPESYNTTYNTQKIKSNKTLEPQPTGEFAKLYEPKAVIGKVAKNANEISGVKLYKLDNSLESAVVIIAGYDIDGNITATSLAKTELISDETNVSINLTLPDNTTAYAVYAVDSLINMQPIAPYKVFGKIKSEANGDYISLKTDFSDYYNKKSISLIANCEITEDIGTENIVYIYGETLDRDSYKYIPFNQSQGKYYIRTGVDGAGTFDETKNTTINIMPDNDGVQKTLSTWNFDGNLSNTGGTDPFVITGGASRTVDGKIKMNTTSIGTAKMDYASPVVVSQGETITVEFDITFGNLTGKTMSYDITDASGTQLISTQICSYDMSGNTKVMIGTSNVLEDYQLLNKAVSKANSKASDNKPTHFKNVIDFAKNKATIYVSAEGTTPAEFTGKLANNSGSVKGINFGTSYINDERACYVDNISTSLVSGPQYKMNLSAKDADNQADVNGSIIVKDGISKAVISPLSDGSYLLCEGDYIIVAEADGYRSIEQKIELTPALESKNVIITMESISSLTKANITVGFYDINNNEIMQSVVPEGEFYVGDEYTVPEKYQKDQIVKKDGKIYLYTYLPEKSVAGTNILEENNNFSMVYQEGNCYDLYENFEEYNILDHTWSGTSSTLAVINDGNRKCLKYSSNGGTIGTYTSIDSIDSTGSSVEFEADFKLAPAGTSGNSQFVLSSSSPTFLSDNINYGIGTNGHILAFEYNTGKTLLVNGRSVPTNLIGSWVHVNANIDFSTKKINLILTSETGEKIELLDLNFYSNNEITDIGSIYFRAAKTNGTISVDNISLMRNQ